MRRKKQACETSKNVYKRSDVYVNLIGEHECTFQMSILRGLKQISTELMRGTGQNLHDVLTFTFLDKERRRLRIFRIQDVCRFFVYEFEMVYIFLKLMKNIKFYVTRRIFCHVFDKMFNLSLFLCIVKSVIWMNINLCKKK